MSLAALPTFLLLPPANLLVPACAGAAFHRHRIGRLVLVASLAGLLLFGMPVVSVSLLTALERNLPLTPAANDRPAAIVVLSGDEDEGMVDGRRTFGIGSLTLWRERAAAALARRTGLPVLLSGGHIHDYAPALADMMGRSMHDDFGITAKWLETSSRDTWQNAAFSADILRAEHITSAYVVTDAWHMRRALIAFGATGLHVTAAPVILHPPLRPSLDVFIPGTQAWEFGYLALHEWIGCAWYSLRAGI